MGRNVFDWAAAKAVFGSGLPTPLGNGLVGTGKLVGTVGTSGVDSLTARSCGFLRQPSWCSSVYMWDHGVGRVE